MPGGGAQRERLHTLNRALDVLEAFEPGDSGLSLALLSDRSGITKPTLRRLLQNLVGRGYVEQDPQTRLYRLGLRCWDLGTIAVHGLGLAVVAPLLRQLAHETREQVTLWVYDGGRAVCVQRAESSQRVSTQTRLGTREPAHLMAAGRCLLAGVDMVAVHRDLTQFRIPRAELDDLDEELARLRLDEAAVSVSAGNRWPDVYAVAAPVRGHLGQVIASLSVSGPKTRLDDDTVLRISEQVRRAAARASEALGFSNGAGPRARGRGLVEAAPT